MRVKYLTHYQVSVAREKNYDIVKLNEIVNCISKNRNKVMLTLNNCEK